MSSHQPRVYAWAFAVWLLVTTSRSLVEVKEGLIGSCTNSTYKNMIRAASLMKQALAKGLKSKVQGNPSPKMTVSLILAGSLEFNPVNDSLTCPNGSELKRVEPFGDGCPVRGLDPAWRGHLSGMS